MSLMVFALVAEFESEYTRLEIPRTSAIKIFPSSEKCLLFQTLYFFFIQSIFKIKVSVITFSFGVIQFSSHRTSDCVQCLFSSAKDQAKLVGSLIYFTLILIYLISAKISTHNINSNEDSSRPCRTPLLKITHPQVVPVFMTVLRSYMFQFISI